MNSKRWLALALLLLVGSASLLLYPIISAKYTAAHQSLVCSAYTDQVSHTDEAAVEAALSAAQDYNTVIAAGAKDQAFTAAALQQALDSYADLLNLSGDGIMGWLEIPKIGMQLPIYHGTADTTLARGVGHLVGSSLPVGGASTHSVLTAHSGMASNIMFSDLPDLKPGDLFYIHVLDQTLVYRVDQSLIVRPEETAPLQIEQSDDYCTLITCYPFGVNTHRLLVRGARVVDADIASTDGPDGPSEVQQNPASAWLRAYIKGVAVGVLAAAVLLLMVYLLCKKRRDNNGRSV